MKVLSLFDGVSSGMVALERAGISVDMYVAYEINEHAIKISRKNYPQIEQRGDVTKADFTQFKGIDLIIAGSPCQGFSIAGKQMNFNDPRSKLYFEFERALREAQPKYFLLENVKMKKEFAEFITSRLGVPPIEINSKLLSAQSRKRVYWTNIPNVKLPEDKGIMLLDIAHETLGDDVDLEAFKVPISGDLQILHGKETAGGKVGYFRKDSQANRVYSANGKAVTLCGEAGGGAAKMGQYLFGTFDDGYIRRLTPIECERLQTLPDNYTFGIPNAQRYKCLGNGWTVDVIAHIFKGLKDKQ